MKTLSVTETREQLSSVIQSVQDDDVVIQNRGRSKAVIIPFSDYELLREAREKERVKTAVEALKQLASQVSANFTDMTDDEVTALSDQVVRESIESLEAQGKITFAS